MTKDNPGADERGVEEWRTHVARKWQRIDAEAEIHTDDGEALAHLIGIRDGFSEAVQFIDQLTGGDGEYRYCTIPGDRHCPTPAEMIERIVNRLKSETTSDQS
jgi:hypothetical protein